MVAIETGCECEVWLARLESSDGELVRRFFYRLSPETLYRRFHSPITRPEQAHPAFLLNVDHVNRSAVVAVSGGEIVGVARYVSPKTGAPAEVAVVVADAWHRQGIATRLMHALEESARSVGIERFAMTMQADNRAVLSLMKRLYPDARLIASGGVVETVVKVA